MQHDMTHVQHTIAVTGIDTGVGKSYCTGLLASYLFGQSASVTTMKLVQTGCSGVAEDILLHRKLMNISLTEDDKEGLTNPYVFAMPASPNLAAALDGKTIATTALDEAANKLKLRYQWLIVEGAGGLMVPLNDETLLIDYLATHEWPMILVTSPKLGSINHTRLSLEAIANRGMGLLGLVYNLHGSHPMEIVRDTLRECRCALKDCGFADRIVLLPDIRESSAANWQTILKPLQASLHSE